MVAGGMERFEEKTHALLPRRLAVWHEALAAVDHTQPCADDAHRLGLWLPEAELVMTVSHHRRLYIYLACHLQGR